MVNKFCKFAMFMLCINSMCGCGTKVKNDLEFVPEEDNDSSYTEYVLPMDYDFSKAKESGFVIYNNDSTIENEEKIDEFYNKSLNNEESSIYIIRYTTEGDIVVSTYVYKEGNYTLYIDNRRDGDTDEATIETKEIRSIELSLDNDGRKVIIQKY